MATQWAALRRKLPGHYAYHGITGNHRALARFHGLVRAIWRKWLYRRSPRNRQTRIAFVRLAERYPLPSPCVVHSVYRAARP